MKPTFVLHLAAILCTVVNGQNEWSYDNQDAWPGLCNVGRRQSPVNIEVEQVVPLPTPPLLLQNFDRPYYLTLATRPNSVEVRVSFPTDDILVSGGPLDHPYRFDNIHFHWHSEHTVDGYRYPLESHAVLYSSRFDNLTRALEVPGSVAVIAVFYDVDDFGFDNEELRSVFDHVDENAASGYYAGESETVVELPLNSFFPLDVEDYFVYNGSLTTPQCNAPVLWMIFPHAVSVSQGQLLPFARMPPNYRRLQPLNDRSIFIS